jgi:hypothetical protein
MFRGSYNDDEGKTDVVEEMDNLVRGSLHCQCSMTSSLGSTSLTVETS